MYSKKKTWKKTFGIFNGSYVTEPPSVRIGYKEKFIPKGNVLGVNNYDVDTMLLKVSYGCYYYSLIIRHHKRAKPDDYT